MKNNYELYIFVLLVFAIISDSLSAPTLESDPEASNVYYDQRQNGTENLRIEFNDFAVIISPLESLLTALSLLDPEIVQDLSDNDRFKNANNTETANTKLDSKSGISAGKSRRKGIQLRRGNIVLPLLKLKNKNQD